MESTKWKSELRCAVSCEWVLCQRYKDIEYNEKSREREKKLLNSSHQLKIMKMERRENPIQSIWNLWNVFQWPLITVADCRLQKIFIQFECDSGVCLWAFVLNCRIFGILCFRSAGTFHFVYRMRTNFFFSRNGTKVVSAGHINFWNGGNRKRFEFQIGISRYRCKNMLHSILCCLL